MIIPENEPSLKLGIFLRQANKNFAFIQKTYAKASVYTKRGFFFEETTALKNNLNGIRSGKNEIYITDRDSKWPYPRNDCLSDLVVFAPEQRLSPIRGIQAKCCLSPENCIKAITAQNAFGGSKYPGVALVIPEDQRLAVKKSLSERKEKLAQSNPNTETSIFDQENTELSGFYAFKPTDQTIRPLSRVVTALDGLTDSEEILSPSYSEMIDITNEGLNAKSLRQEILKTNIYCIRNLTKKNLPVDLTFDAIYSISDKESTKFIIRFCKTVGAATAAAVTENYLGKAGVSLSKSDDIVLTSSFRILANLIETSVVAVKQPQSKNKILKKINSDLLEEAERFTYKIFINKRKSLKK